MDNLCHTLTGAALARAGLGARTRLGTATLLVAANLPDVDVAVFFTETLPVSFRRGWTHGVVAQLALPIALAGLMWTVGKVTANGRRQTTDGQTADGQTADGGRQTVEVRAGQLLLLSYIGLYSHIFLDYMNSYGLRVLMPFSGRWFYGDALYIVDPLMYVMLGAGVWLAGRARRRGWARPWRPARVALAVATGYALVMLASNHWARSVVREGLARAGRGGDTRFMVTPVLGNPLRREVLVDTGGRYEKGLLWFEPWPHFRPAGYGVDKGFDQPEAQTALETPVARAYLSWARFPFVVVDRTVAPPRILLNDYRYSDTTGRLGWAMLGIQLSGQDANPTSSAQ